MDPHIWRRHGGRAEEPIPPLPPWHPSMGGWGPDDDEAALELLTDDEAIDEMLNDEQACDDEAIQHRLYDQDEE